VYDRGSTEYRADRFPGKKKAERLRLWCAWNEGENSIYFAILIIERTTPT
jgi:hypothetical protein